MTLPTAIAQSCDTYFYQVGKAFYDLPADRGQPLQRWAKTFGFGQQPGLDVGPATSGLLADDRLEARDVHEEDRPVQLADRPPLEAGRLDPARDRPEGHARLAAADGALLRAARERRQARHAAPRLGDRAAGPDATARRRARRCSAATRRRRRSSTSTRPRSRRSATGCTRRRTRRLGTSASHLRPLSRSRSPARRARPRRTPTTQRVRGQDEHVVVVRLRPVRRAAARRLRGDRERRLRRRGRGARRPSRCSSSSSGRRPPT